MPLPTAMGVYSPLTPLFHREPNPSQLTSPNLAVGITPVSGLFMGSSGVPPTRLTTIALVRGSGICIAGRGGGWSVSGWKLLLKPFTWYLGPARPQHCKRQVDDRSARKKECTSPAQMPLNRQLAPPVLMIRRASPAGTLSAGISAEPRPERASQRALKWAHRQCRGRRPRRTTRRRNARAANL